MTIIKWLSVSLLAVLATGFITINNVSGASSGTLGYCDLTVDIGKGSTTMPWVQAPVNGAQYYSVRTADDSTATDDPTYYTPDVLTPIHIRVKELDMRYIGLIMYAFKGTTLTDDKAVNRIGDWKVPDDLPYQVLSYCDSVTHSDADLKPLHVTLFVKIPKGSGTIIIRSMIKHGEQNSGNFYYPNTLKLTEGNPLLAANNGLYQILLGKKGESCTTTCAANTATPHCSNIGTSQLMDSKNMLMAAQRLVPCQLPVVASCSGNNDIRDHGPLFEIASGLCYHTATKCPSPTTPTTLITIPEYDCNYNTRTTFQRICACVADQLYVPPQPAVGGQGYYLPGPAEDKTMLIIYIVAPIGGVILIAIIAFLIYKYKVNNPNTSQAYRPKINKEFDTVHSAPSSPSHSAVRYEPAVVPLVNTINPKNTVDRANIMMNNTTMMPQMNIPPPPPIKPSSLPQMDQYNTGMQYQPNSLPAMYATANNQIRQPPMFPNMYATNSYPNIQQPPIQYYSNPNPYYNRNY